ncbi:MAG: permease [Firmicutes bacterium]|nr:permease [Bacillota bacterium]
MNLIKKFKAPLLLVLIYLVLAILWPEISGRSAKVAIDYLREMALIIPPVFVLMGLLEVWVPKEKIKKLIGTGSGLKGFFFSFLMGTLPTGPLYIAFPMAGTLLQKGAKVSNVVIFLGAWAAIKIPQLLVEAEFLGLSFTALRFGLTLTAVIVIGFILERLIKAEELPELQAGSNIPGRTFGGSRKSRPLVN